MEMVSGFTVKRALSMLGTAGLDPLTKEQMLDINRKLNKIKKKVTMSLNQVWNRPYSPKYKGGFAML